MIKKEDLLKWQKVILENDDLDIHELIANRAVGKTEFGQYWITQDSDVAIIFVHNARLRKPIIKDIIQSGYKGRLEVVSELWQLKGLRLKGRIRVFVDEMFMMNGITLDALDSALGTADYKVLFAGTRRVPEDKFRISYSKQYIVGLDAMMLDYEFYEKNIQQTIASQGLLNNNAIELN